MNVDRVGAVVRKEVREFRRNRFVVGTMAVTRSCSSSPR